MKFFKYVSTTAILLSIIVVYSESIAQAVSPYHLFNAGLNMGFLSGHVKTQTSKENYGTWAGNASAEWIESWNTGAVQPIIPDIIMPAVAHDDMKKAIMNMSTCFSPYFQARLSLYNAGFHLGEALVQSGTSCSQCFQLDLQRSAIELKTINSLIKRPLYLELSNNLNSMAASLNVNYSDDLSSQQNASLFTPLNTSIEMIQKDLPSSLQQCGSSVKVETTEETVPITQEKTEPAKTKTINEEKRNKRAFIIKIGINSGTLNGTGGLTTDSKLGWQAGLDWYRGKKFFFASSFKFWQNATGEELIQSSPSQLVTTENYYLQGFTLGLGLGAYLYRQKDLNISLTGKVNYILSSAINGNLSSVGDTSAEDNVFQIEIGSQLAYKIVFFEISYELGLNNALISNGVGYKYRLLNLSVGVYIR
ncbi:MAG: hypothetical protein KAK04_12750 [Cyclobacteriaceae bacterium]|nr:hypothetical protein [Cyclobacteriaceae bacterium]